jgi:uncharacterized protein YyaL (SSP411 family)
MSRILVVFLVSLLSLTGAFAAPPSVQWLHDDAAAFTQAKADDRFVILYLEAVWCHWCHVMDHETYADPAVQAALAAHYVPLRIDQDSRPDLANRYRDYGWPATIVFAADGTEIVKRRGFIPPDRMAKLLAAIVADPKPEHAVSPDIDSASAQSSLSDSVRDTLAERHRSSYDAQYGGLKLGQKYLDRDAAEYQLTLGLAGDTEELARARKSLDGARALIDPVWGGVYQYSTGGDYAHPHFEKLATLQGDYLRLYALGFAATGDQGFKEAAEALMGYIAAFLKSPDGGYYTSQDADLVKGEHSAEYFALDDAARRKLGVPHVDDHRYTRETATIAEGLAAWYETSGDASALAAARSALEWVVKERALPDGGYRHDAKDAAGPYLGDSLAAGRAMLALYRASGERLWLTRAASAGDFIAREFKAGGGGFASAALGLTPIPPVPNIDENMQVARFLNLVARFTGDTKHGDSARHALAWLARPETALSRLTDAGILLADREIGSEPVHLTVIGPKADAATAALFAACLRVPATYKRLDWWDREEGPLPNPDVNYPKLKKPAAFVCTAQRCSTPIYKPEDVQAFLAEE